MNNDATEAALGLLGLSPNNLPTLSLIPLKRKQSSTSISAGPLATDDNSADDISCICGFTYDDGFSIACDDCSKWCHAACFGIVEGEVPEEWRCWQCVPRLVDREKAVKLQKTRQRQAQEHYDVERHRRRNSPGMDRKHRRASASAIDGGNPKRKRRSSINVPTQPTEDEHVDIDEPWTHSYVHITQDIIPHQETRDKLRRQAQHWRGVTALSPSSPFDTTPERLPDQPLPQTAIQPLPHSSLAHPSLSLNANPSIRPPSYALHTTTPIPSSHLITPFTSTIIPSSTYLSDPLNAYAHLGMPKPFVHLMGAPLDVTLDSRITGDKSRFVRSGCRPNAVLRPVLCPNARPDDRPLDDTLSFGVFASRDLKANEEVVLGWEWDDGNAVHSLPALIEAPHMFPVDRNRTHHHNSPHQLEHLRKQMSNILHALSSTFTTCACGSKARDCALTQMAAFVEGEEGPSGDVDLGPLVGVQRGFKTREKVPFSGGMSGVEMCAEEDLGSRKTMALPVVTLSPASPGRYRDKGKGKAVAVGERGSESESPLGSGQEDTGSKRSGKKRPRRRITVDTSRPDRLHPSPPQQPREGIGEAHQPMEVEEVEDKMPPKMRKRWIHRSAEALKDSQTRSSESPGGSVVSLGSATSGGIGLGIRMEGHSGDSGDGENDRMEVDADPKEMPPPPMPAALDPTTISSVNPWLPSRNPPHDPQMNTVSTSPSTSFAKLSLLSPIVPIPPASVASGSQHRSTLSPHQSWSPFEQDGANESTATSAIDVKGDMITPSHSSDSPSYFPESDSNIESRLRFDSPELSILPVSFERHPPSRESPLPPDTTRTQQRPLQESPQPHDEPSTNPDPLPPDEPLTQTRSSQESSHPHCESSTTTTPPPSPPQITSAEPEYPEEPQPAAASSPRQPALDLIPPRSTPSVSPPPVLAPTPPPPPPPPLLPKVKLSLKDFAIRKKKQREEMAKRQTSPTCTQPSLGTPSSPRLSGEDVEMASGDRNGVEGAYPMAEVGTTDGHQIGSKVNGHPNHEPQPNPAEQVSETDGSMIQGRPHSPPLVPSTMRSPSPHLTNGTTEVHTLEVTRQAKVELIEQPIPNGVSAIDHIERSRRALNGGAKAQDPINAPPRAASPSPLPPDSRDHSRRLSQEDGEIPSTSSDTPPLKPKQPPFNSFLTPPTQPRSFHTAPGSPSVSTPSPAAAASAARRLPHHPHRPTTNSTQFQPGTAPGSRPPSGPRALRVGNHISHGQQPVYTPPSRGPQFIPRGPSADRERMEWDRERAWPRTRGRGPGSSAGTGWGR